MVNRLLNPLKTNSFFLFGARATGKTTFIDEFLSKEKIHKIDLLSPHEFNKYSLYPERLSQEIDQLKPTWCFVDEVQRVPELLNVVHQLIHKKKSLFALTGSSARKLKRGGANLLAGRALMNYLYPLTFHEIENFNLIRALEFGSLPGVYLAETDLQRKEILNAYVYTYLKEEIAEEQIVRKLEPFRRFLPIAAQMNGKIVNYSNVANDIGVATVTVQSYFQILEDTLIGFNLPAYHQSVRKQQRQNPKFYFFDLGVVRALNGVLDYKIPTQGSDFGDSFEHFIVLELKRLASYYRKNFEFSYLRTKDDAEIDLIISRPGMKTVLLEIKSTDNIQPRHLQTLKSFSQDFKGAELICLSRELTPRKEDGVTVYPWQEGVFAILGL